MHSFSKDYQNSAHWVLRCSENVIFINQKKKTFYEKYLCCKWLTREKRFWHYSCCAAATLASSSSLLCWQYSWCTLCLATAIFCAIYIYYRSHGIKLNWLIMYLIILKKSLRRRRHHHPYHYSCSTYIFLFPWICLFMLHMKFDETKKKETILWRCLKTWRRCLMMLVFIQTETIFKSCHTTKPLLKTSKNENNLKFIPSLFR